MVRRPASCRRLNSIEAHLGQIERLDKHVDQTSLRTAALRQNRSVTNSATVLHSTYPLAAVSRTIR